MEINAISNFLSIAIVGVALSAVVEAIKAKWGPTAGTTKLMVVLLSVVLGTGYWLLKDTVLYQSILGILAAASATYALIFK